MDVYLKDFARSPVFGHRITARPIRERINNCLLEQKRVVINFRGIEATQSFIDELIGALILQHGPEVLSRLSFADCSESMKGILRFVIHDRIQQQFTLAAEQREAAPAIGLTHAQTSGSYSHAT